MSLADFIHWNWFVVALVLVYVIVREVRRYRRGRRDWRQRQHDQDTCGRHGRYLCRDCFDLDG